MTNTLEIFFNLNPVNFFLVSGVVQNFILAAILFFRKGESVVANKILSVIVLIVNLHLAFLMILDTNADNLFPAVLRIPFSYLTAIGPLILLYTRALTDANFRFSNISATHFIPLIIEVLLQIIMIVQGINRGQIFYNTPFYFYITPLIYLWTAGSIFIYLRNSLTIINSHESWALQNFSNLREVTLNWLRKLIRYYRIFWVVWIPFVSAFLLFFRFQLMYLGVVLALYVLMLMLTYLTFWIGLEGLGRGTVIIIKHQEEQRENKNFSRIEKTEIDDHITEITRLMETNKMYLNENLSLRDLASELKADPNLISFILNKHMGGSFYDFVSRYRIEEVKHRLNDPAHKHLTLLGIALESGFNSKTTFNRVFKQITGFTPTQYQKERQKNIE